MPQSFAMSQSNVLRVLSGLHRGASVSLRRPGMIVIGSAPDCDLILMDAGVAPRHAAIVLYESEIALRALDGAMALEGREIAPGRVSRIASDAHITMGTSAVTVAMANRDADFGGPQNSGPASAATMNGVRRKTVATVVIGCAVVAALVAASFAPFSSGEARGEPADRRTATLLSQLGLQKEITVTQSQDGQLTLTGTMPDERSYAKLLSELAARGLTPVLEVSSRERIASDVRNVFRVNGMDVAARYTQSGVVLVNGVAAPKRDVDRVVQHALRDVRGLKEVRINGAVAQPAPAPVNVAAKRVVSVVDGSPAYLVTADGARYFVGALLPQGQRVVAIKGSAVTVERNGEQLVMNF